MLRPLRSRLSLRIAGALLIGSLVPVVGGALLALRRVEQSAQAEAQRRERWIAERALASVQSEIERAEAKLTTVARLLATELDSAEIADASTRDGARRSVARLTALVDPPDAFLELQYFHLRPDGTFEPELVTQAQQVEVTQRQALFPNGRNLQNIASNAVSPNVQTPLREGKPFRSSALESYEGFTTLKTSFPVGGANGTLGALVAYVDFRPLQPKLEELARDGAALEVADDSGTSLFASPPIAGVTLEQRLDSGPWSVHVREPSSVVDVPLARLRRQVELWTALAVALAVALSFALSAWIARPVARLRDAAERMAAGDLGARAGFEREDELGQLAASFDRMAQAVARLDEAKSEFVANVSHELRTPLASMQLSIGNLLEGIVGAPTDAQRVALERLRRDLERTNGLVGDLLELAKLEAGAVAPRRAHTDLVALARECADDLGPLARGKEVEIGVAGLGSAQIDPALTRRVLANLLDNAIKYGPRGGRISIDVRERGFRVRDQGPGLPDERVFERFHQGTTDGVKHSGAGLGLAIVEKLVELQGGRVRAHSDGGAVFDVSFEEGGA